MNYKKLVNELDSLMDLIKSEQKKNEKTVEYFFSQLTEEEKNIRKDLKNENNKTSRKKLKNKLGMVRQAFGTLEAV